MRALRRALGPGFEVQTPAARGQSFSSLLRIYRLMLRFSSVAALVIGMFMIYNSFAIAGAQRRKEIGILRALGATRRQIGTLFLGESFLGGLVGSALGVVAGYALSGVVAGRAGQFVERLVGVNQGAISVTIEPWLIAMAMVIGVVTSTIAAAWPARTAATLDPVKALQKGLAQLPSARASRARALAAVLAVVVAAALLTATSSLRRLLPRLLRRHGGGSAADAVAVDRGWRARCDRPCARCDRLKDRSRSTACSPRHGEPPQQSRP